MRVAVDADELPISIASARPQRAPQSHQRGHAIVGAPAPPRNGLPIVAQPSWQFWGKLMLTFEVSCRSSNRTTWNLF
jgi:hypothetical protein